ncbi:MAG: hypothetical protein Q9202_007472 [Teloschistes flavicans]
MEDFFETTNYIYRIVDVNGMRSGRTQWKYTWEGADCLFFVAPIAGYNRCLCEDATANQLTESLLLFESLLSMKDLKAIPIVLILNKVDIFMQQIQEHPLREWFPDFVGRDNDWEAAKQYIEARFTALKELDNNREFRVYYTDATNIIGYQEVRMD